MPTHLLSAEAGAPEEPNPLALDASAPDADTPDAPGAPDTPDALAGDAPPPPVPPVPPAPPFAAAAPRPRAPWRTTVVAAMVAAVVAAGVTAPIVLRADGANGADSVEAASGTAATALVERDSAVATDAVPADGSVAEVAAAASPSVAYVETSGPAGAGSGSAVIVDADGLLVTNAHVVANATAVAVVLPDGSRLDADVVGTDTTSDLALLAVDAEGLPAATFATEEAAVGDVVVAIGSPFGLEGSVTSGIVSAVDRDLAGPDGTLTGMLQTDAAINPGNSGGALVDLDGRVVGIATAIVSTTGASSGVGFATPAASVTRVVDALADGGTVAYAQLGVAGTDAAAGPGSTVPTDPTDSAGDVAAVDLRGALVTAVTPGTGAAEAGLRAGDVVTAVDAEPITSMAALAGAVRAAEPGDVVALTIVRDDDELVVDVTLTASGGAS